MIACCGLNCGQCEIYKATRSDAAERVRVAEAWSRKFGFHLKAEDISCDGCARNGGRLFSHCTQCKVRSCCREKALPNCAQCQEAPCGKLAELFAMSGHIKKAFEALERK
ncbi:MAG: DUF3795 domain-containing protein [Thermodesulfobacteriota bacterium]